MIIIDYARPAGAGGLNGGGSFGRRGKMIVEVGMNPARGGSPSAGAIAAIAGGLPARLLAWGLNGGTIPPVYNRVFRTFRAIYLRCGGRNGRICAIVPNWLLL